MPFTENRFYSISLAAAGSRGLRSVGTRGPGGEPGSGFERLERGEPILEIGLERQETSLPQRNVGDRLRRRRGTKRLSQRAPRGCVAHVAEDLDRSLVRGELLLAREGANDQRVHDQVGKAQTRRDQTEHREAGGQRERQDPALAGVSQDLVRHLLRNDRVDAALRLARQPLGEIERRVVGGEPPDGAGLNERERVTGRVVPGRLRRAGERVGDREAPRIARRGVIRKIRMRRWHQRAAAGAREKEKKREGAPHARQWYGETRAGEAKITTRL